MLKNHAYRLPELAKLGIAIGGDVMPVDHDTAFRRPLQKVQHADERTFPRTGAANDPEDFPALDMQAHACQCV